MSSQTQLDPIKFEVIRNALVEATEEMAAALRHSAYSTNIKTRADFSCAFFDRRLQPVAQAFAQPNHLGSLAELVPLVVKEYGPENLGQDVTNCRELLPRTCYFPLVDTFFRHTFHHYCLIFEENGEPAAYSGTLSQRTSTRTKNIRPDAFPHILKKVRCLPRT